MYGSRSSASFVWLEVYEHITNKGEMAMGLVSLAHAVVGAIENLQAAKPQIEFGEGSNQTSHATRHVTAAGINVDLVKSIITKDLRSRINGLPVSSAIRDQTVIVNAIEIQYSAYRKTNGVWNVGKIKPPR